MAKKKKASKKKTKKKAAKRKVSKYAKKQSKAINWSRKANKPKPSLKNKDGSHSSEITATIEYQGGYINVPTIDPSRRMSVSHREGIRMEEKATGGKPKVYKTVKKAVLAAGKRSRAGGRDRKR